MENVHLKIKEALTVKGMSQKDFAKEMGKTQTQISKWLSGTNNFTQKTISKIELVLGPLEEIETIDTFMEEIGFRLMTGPIWTHELYGVINITDLDKRSIIHNIFINGENNIKKRFRNLFDI